MSGMNQFLAEYFGTSAPSEDELQKQAQAELFLKLAEEEGIDIDQLSDEQVEELYNATFAEDGDAGEQTVEEDSMATKAAAEWATQKEAADKFAEAEFMGRTMAHAYVDELKKIAAGNLDPNAAAAAERKAKLPGGGAVRGSEKAMGAGKQRAVGKVEGAVREGAHGAKLRVGGGLRRLGHAVSGGRLKDTVSAAKGQGQIFSRDMLKTRKATLAGMGATAAGAALAAGAGAAGYKALKGKEKKSAAIDTYAGNLAAEKLAEAGWDPNEAVELLSAVIALDDGEDSKIAYAENLEQAVEIRALELAELAGYPVEWTE